MPDSEPRIITSGDISFGSPLAVIGSSSISSIELVALFAFVGTVLFCVVQAIAAPRKTFCAEHQRQD